MLHRHTAFWVPSPSLPSFLLLLSCVSFPCVLQSIPLLPLAHPLPFDAPLSFLPVPHRPTWLSTFSFHFICHFVSPLFSVSRSVIPPISRFFIRAGADVHWSFFSYSSRPLLFSVGFCTTIVYLAGQYRNPLPLPHPSSR